MNIVSKVFVTVVFLFLATGVSTFAQLYVQAGAGYGIGTAGQTFGTRSSGSDNNGEAETSEILNTSFGSGVRFGGAAGYLFSKSFGVELGAQYLLGQEVTVDESTGSTFYSNKSTGKGSGFFLSPALTISSEFGGFSPFAKFGAVLGFPKIIIADYSSGSQSATSEHQRTASGGMAIGFVGGAGIIVPVAERFAIVADITSTTLSYAPTKLTRDKQLINGVEQPIPDEEKNIDLTTKRNSSDESQLTFNMPFSNVALNIGVRMNF